MKIPLSTTVCWMKHYFSQKQREPIHSPTIMQTDSSLLGLPHELLLQIFSNLSFQGLYKISLVCKSFHNISRELFFTLESKNLLCHNPKMKNSFFRSLHEPVMKSNKKISFFGVVERKYPSYYGAAALSGNTMSWITARYFSSPLMYSTNFKENTQAIHLLCVESENTQNLIPTHFFELTEEEKTFMWQASEDAAPPEAWYANTDGVFQGALLYKQNNGQELLKTKLVFQDHIHFIKTMILLLDDQIVTVNQKSYRLITQQELDDYLGLVRE